MAKLYKYTPVATEYTVLRFNGSSDDSLSIKEYDSNVVSITGDESAIAKLVAEQHTEINFTEISIDEFLPKAANSTQGRFAIKQEELRFKKAIAELTRGATPEEVSGWPKQEELAKKQLADESAAVPQLVSLATTRAKGETPVQLATKIASAASLYEAAYLEELGKFQASKRRVLV